ncbi:MAG: hypothetical protein ACFE9L_16160 [Candidatus Hodarchaeota archaeon]
MSRLSSSKNIDFVIIRQMGIIKFVHLENYLQSNEDSVCQIFHAENESVFGMKPIGKEDCLLSDNEDFDELEIEEEEEDIETPPIRTKEPSAKVPTGSRITLFFRSTIGPGEKLEKLTIDPEMAVLELKETLGGIFGLDPQDFHLSISGRTLDADDILSNYDLEEGLECLIIPVSTAGYN